MLVPTFVNLCTPTVNFRTITMAGLRRLLEDDLKLDKFTLDLYKKFISQQLDEVSEKYIKSH